MVSTHAVMAKHWFDRGNECKRTGDYAGALDAFRKSIKLNPHVAAPWLGLSQILEANSQLEDARQCLEHATQADPNNFIAKLHLARALKNLAYTQQAQSEYLSVIALNPNSAEAFVGLGQLLEDIGQALDAADAYRQALKLAPNQTEALANLLSLGRHLDISHEIDCAQNLLPSLAAREKALIGYGLGKALDQQQDYDAAFQAYDAANQARRAAFGAFDRKAFDARIDQMIRLFSQSFYSDRRDWGLLSSRAVFIVGLPRSGTTLTEQIIASHPKCFGAGELPILSDLATGTPDRLGSANTAWPECARELDKQQILALGQDYLEQSSVRAPRTATRIVDKQPLNFWHLGLIALALPKARIIHCQRDIRDCGFSIFSHNFNVQQKWSTNLADIAHYWRGYQRLMQHWMQVSGLKILTVDYESTVADLTGSARNLLSFLNLPWDERVLAFHKHERAVQTPSRWQVRQPLYSSSAGRWQHYQQYLRPLCKAVEHANT